MRLHAIFALTFTSLTFLSCKSAGDDSGVKVINASLTTDIPAVVKIFMLKGTQWEGCTGTFLNETTVITALHCISDGQTGQLYDAFLAGFSKSPQVARYFDQNYLSNLKQKLFLPERDIAVLKFDPAISRAYHITSFPKIAKREAIPGEPVTVMGFGATVPNGPSVEKKSSGKNVVAYVAKTYVALLGVEHVDAAQTQTPTGTSVSVGGGDSGGPLLDDANQILGMSSYMYSDPVLNWRFFAYAKSNNALTRELLSQAGYIF